MKSSYESGQEDSKYTDTLNQMYDTALASIHRETMKQHRKKSVFGRTADDAEPKNDESSTSTASSDCTAGHDEAYESFQSRDGDTSLLPSSLVLFGNLLSTSKREFPSDSRKVGKRFVESSRLKCFFTKPVIHPKIARHVDYRLDKRGMRIRDLCKLRV